jgi:hypothetical protein
MVATTTPVPDARAITAPVALGASSTEGAFDLVVAATAPAPNERTTNTPVVQGKPSDEGVIDAAVSIVAAGAPSPTVPRSQEPETSADPVVAATTSVVQGASPTEGEIDAAPLAATAAPAVDASATAALLVRGAPTADGVIDTAVPAVAANVPASETCTITALVAESTPSDYERVIDMVVKIDTAAVPAPAVPELLDQETAAAPMVPTTTSVPDAHAITAPVVQEISSTEDAIDAAAPLVATAAPALNARAAAALLVRGELSTEGAIDTEAPAAAANAPAPETRAIIAPVVQGTPSVEGVIDTAETQSPLLPKTWTSHPSAIPPRTPEREAVDGSVAESPRFHTPCGGMNSSIVGRDDFDAAHTVEAESPQLPKVRTSHPSTIQPRKSEREAADGFVADALRASSAEYLTGIPQPPSGGSWEWPLSRCEKKARVVLLDLRMASLQIGEIAARASLCN